MTTQMIDVDAIMIRHAAARGAVRTPDGLATLVGWPPAHKARCLVRRGSDDSARHHRPYKTDVEPVVCRICGGPADWRPIVLARMELCERCAKDEGRWGQ